ncbi:MAG: TIGR03767 family metallophosphoesterase [Candidatus Dormibacteraceae bacterium]
MKARAVGLTTQRTLGPGSVLGSGSRGSYRVVAELEGEPHIVRRDLVGDANPGSVEPRRPISAIAHITDLHVTDVQSPARFEFVNREWEDPRFRELLTMQRPQEALNVHAIDAMVRALNAIESGPVTGGAIALMAMTGDSIDNTQRNELDNFLALFDGRPVQPDSGAPGYEGVQSAGWPDDFCWKPDGPGDGDIFRRDLGYPAAPGLLEHAIQPFKATGLRRHWLGCYGNHEEVCQGVGVVTPGLARAMAGSRKPIALPPGVDRETALETFVKRPEFFMTGAFRDVTPDPARRPITRMEFVAAHHESGPHGFTDQNRSDGTAYYVHDTRAVRFITLDTVCAAGGADGSIDPPQLHWLERRLEEAHSSFRSRDGSIVRTRYKDRLVVVLSHHGYDTLANPRDERRNDELLDLLLRFDNVVLWLNGHIHANRITPRSLPHGNHGLWEVTTSSLVDWPCQARLVEMFEAGDGLIAIACTMVDHEGTVREGVGDLPDLAGLHRELAANVPFNGFDSWRPGTPADRNAILLLRRPF